MKRESSPNLYALLNRSVPITFLGISLQQELETSRIEEGEFLATLEALENRCEEVVHSLACAISVLYHVGVDNGFWCGAL